MSEFIERLEGYGLALAEVEWEEIYHKDHLPQYTDVRIFSELMKGYFCLRVVNVQLFKKEFDIGQNETNDFDLFYRFVALEWDSEKKKLFIKNRFPKSAFVQDELIGREVQKNESEYKKRYAKLMLRAVFEKMDYYPIIKDLYLWVSIIQQNKKCTKKLEEFYDKLEKEFG